MKRHIDSNNPYVHKVAVVGAGLGGLLLANELLGRDVPVELELFEAGDAAGGRARTLRMGGAMLNLGPHALYLDGHLAGLLERWGILPSGGQPRRAWGLADDELHRLPESPWALLSTGLLPGFSRFRFAAAMLRIAKLSAADFADRSAAEFIASLSDDERVTGLLRALGRLSTYVGALDRLSADVLIGQLQLSLGGILYPDGGWQQMVDALEARLGAHGVSVRCGQRVEHVAPGPDGVELRLNDASYNVDAVVLATGPKVATRLLSPRFHEDASLGFEPDPVRAACLDLVVDRWPRASADLCLGVDAPIYISNHSRYAELAGDDRHVVHAARYMTADDDLAASTVRQGLEQALDRFQPGWRDGLIEARFLPRMNVVHHTPSPKTAGLAGRPEASPHKLPNIYLVGDWVGPSGWLSDGVAASAQQAAQAIAERLSHAATSARTG